MNPDLYPAYRAMPAYTPPVAPATNPATTYQVPTTVTPTGQPGLTDPGYHPQVTPPQASPSGPTTPSAPAPTGPYALPPGQTLSQTASGTQAQPFDVTLSQLATAVYGTRGPPPQGWSTITDKQLTDAGVKDPQGWRLTYLGSNDSTPRNDQEFKAEIYTDGQGDYVLSYRGTAEGGPDWDNNFRQGLGYVTNDGDKFGVTAVNTAIAFKAAFGNNKGGEPTNLAITGHSQGGGLASVGSLGSGVPAVTFDASGIHPDTLDRMQIAPQDARKIAEGGQIRAYSLSSDALTKAQDSWITGLVAPDALGTQIVVAPSAADEHQMFNHYGPMELVTRNADGTTTPKMTPEQIAALNTGVELARNPLTGTLLSAPAGLVGGSTLGGILGGPRGFLIGGAGGALLAPLITVGGGNVAYSAISHSPNALTAGMIDHQPWQAGYQNPSSAGRDAQNLLPDAVKDDYARNTHDFATDVDHVVATDFAEHQYVQGGASLAGDFGEGFFNSSGDTVDGYADALAVKVDQSIGGPVGTVLSAGIDGAGDVLEFGDDVVGQGVETLADGTGWVAQRATNFVGGLFNR